MCYDKCDYCDLFFEYLQVLLIISSSRPCQRSRGGSETTWAERRPSVFPQWRYSLFTLSGYRIHGNIRHAGILGLGKTIFLSLQFSLYFWAVICRFFFFLPLLWFKQTPNIPWQHSLIPWVRHWCSFKDVHQMFV